MRPARCRWRRRARTRQAPAPPRPAARVARLTTAWPTAARSRRPPGPSRSAGCGFAAGRPWACAAGAGSEGAVGQRRVITTSRYALGTTSEAAPAVFVFVQQFDQVVLQHLRLLGGQCGEGLVHWPVPLAEDVDEVGRRAIAEVEDARRHLQAGGAVAEQGPQVRLHAPQRRRLQAGGRRQLPPEHLEHAADQAVGRPVGQADATAGLAHTDHLGGGPRLIGREHDTERGQHGVEPGIGERQCLGVGRLECHLQAVGTRAFGATLEQAGDVVGRRHPAAAAGSGQRGVAVAGGHVEHLLVAAQVAGLGEQFAHQLQRRADDGVVAARPGCLLTGLEGGEVDGCIHGAGLLAVWTAAKGLPGEPHCSASQRGRPARTACGVAPPSAGDGGHASSCPCVRTS